jgi:hypothetical protein
MKEELRFNICGLESSYVLNDDVPHIEKLVERNIPPHLSYSCWYWANHLTGTKEDAEILELLKHFIRVQFLFWLEVLSITKRTNTAYGMISFLIDKIPVSSMLPSLLQI